MILVMMTATLVLSACGGGSSGGTTPPPDGGTPDPAIADCTAGPLLTALPLAETDFTDLAPLGNLNPSGHTFPTMHHYFYITNSDGVGAPDVVPVYMPGDAWVTSINTSEHLSASPPYTDYSLSFKPCNQYRSYFGHVQGLSTDLQNLLNQTTEDFCNTYTTGGKDYRYCGYTVSHYVQAGTQIGETGGRDGQFALDFGARDERQTPLQWANQTRWSNGGGDAMYTACVSNAYEPTLKQTLESRFGYSLTPRTVAPVCGTIEQDVPGTAQGVWFVAGTAANEVFPEDEHLALVHDNYDPNLGVISIGTSLSMSPGKFRFTPVNGSGVINREFSEVSNDGSIYCYPLISGGAVLINMTASDSLQAEFQAATDCAAGGYVFTAAAVNFVR